LAVLRAEGSALTLHEIPLEWSEEHLLVRSGMAKTDADGRFAFEGLEPRLHDVEVTSTPETRVLLATKEVTAPTDWIELDVDCARLLLRVQSAGQPIEADIQIVQNRRGNGSVWGFGSQSTVEVLVPPASAWELEAEKPGYSRATTAWSLPARRNDRARSRPDARPTARRDS
jgi:hypothetical protein